MERRRAEGSSSSSSVRTRAVVACCGAALLLGACSIDGAIDVESGDAVVMLGDVDEHTIASSRSASNRARRDTSTTITGIETGGEAEPPRDPSRLADRGTVTSIGRVVEGKMIGPCFPVAPDGAGDPRLVSVWEVITSVATPDVLADLDLVVGYERCETCNALALVQVLDRGGSVVVLAVDVSSLDVSSFDVTSIEDPAARRVTIVHELAHVVTQRPGTQLNPWTGAGRCYTHHNGTGCLAGTSYLWAWIQRFWTADALATLPDDGSLASGDVVRERCLADRSFTGTYAATRPDEDFAESFAAYVLDIDVDPAVAPKLAFFDDYPEFVAMRDNARAAGLAGSSAHFDGCT